MKSPIKNILIPTDFSNNAINALDFALQIAQQLGASLHILHSIEEPYDFAPMPKEVKKGVTGKVKQLLDKTVSDIRNQGYSDLYIQTHIQTGKTTYAILDEVRSFDIDLVVMGTRGRSGLEKFLFGSTTADIVQQSEIPVLVIPPQAGFDEFERVVFTTNYKDRDLEALDYACNLFQMFNSNIKVLHASVEDSLKNEILFRGFKDLVREKISYDKITFEEAKSITFFESVVEQIEKELTSIVVMVRYDKYISLFGKKQSKEMSFHIEVPLLVIPSQYQNK